jgi:membrane associated rhomboid family serine protease
MKKQIWIGLVFLMISVSLKAQIAESAFHMNWTILKPINSAYIDNVSMQGIRIGYTKFLNERWGIGFEGGYSVLDDYVPRQTYDLSDGAITTDFFNYMYYITAVANVQYNFRTSGLLIPFASLGIGGAYTDYTVYYNVYSETDTGGSFVLRPKVGALYRFSTFSSLGLKAAIGYEYATNNSDRFETNNFSAMSFQVGIVLFSN